MAKRKKAKPAPTNEMRVVGNDTIEFRWFTGSVEDVNYLLAGLGYDEVAIRHSIMSGKAFVEAKGTPNYCSPASEAYWCM